ncbi:nucleolar protein 11 [Rhodnius prolixus]|uniref:Nucleolar protein 11 N-terminal domain-containing protein n=1 Tax=Rhodnius prolixus TaxID=13249 RepID=R4G5M0_RHOPR
MAKLLPPYTLCPLIEHRKCLGVCEDSTPGCVIVTLGKNIVIRYRLSDQKQVRSWSSKDKLSAPVIFDFTSKRYIAIFKFNQVAFWSDDSMVQLNKLKNFKFNRLIHGILSAKEYPPVIIYKSGRIGILQDDLASRKCSVDEQFLEESEEILSSNLVLISGHLYVNLLTLNKKVSFKKLHFIPIDADRVDQFSVSLEDRSSASINAHTLIQGESTSLISLWSDGSIYSAELPLKDTKSFPGRVSSKVESVNLLQPAAMHSIGEQQVVIYGAAPNSEGAVLCIFNLKYGFVDSLQKLKVYCDTPRLWVVGTVGTNRYILCLSGGHLVVIPTRFGTQRLCSLVGVAKLNSLEMNDSVSTPPSALTATWKYCNETVDGNDMEVEPNQLCDRIMKMRKAGLSDHRICEVLLPELIKKQEEEQITEFLSLINDIPDYYLIDMAVIFNNNHFSGQLLEKVLKYPLVSDHSSLQLVRSRVNLQTALELLAFITRMMDNSLLVKSLLDWACLLLDSHYQQYLLSKDETVIETIKSVNTIIKLHMECIANLKTLQPELALLKKGVIQVKKSTVSLQSYLVDTINLY